MEELVAIMRIYVASFIPQRDHHLIPSYSFTIVSKRDLERKKVIIKVKWSLGLLYLLIEKKKEKRKTRMPRNQTKMANHDRMAT